MLNEDNTVIKLKGFEKKQENMQQPETEIPNLNTERKEENDIGNNVYWLEVNEEQLRQNASKKTEGGWPINTEGLNSDIMTQNKTQGAIENTNIKNKEFFSIRIFFTDLSESFCIIPR